MASLAVRLVNRPDEFQRLEMALDEFAKLEKLPENVVFQSRLVLDELFVNIVNYGYDDDDKHIIEVDLTVSEDELQIDLRDDGIPFDPLTEAPELDVDASLDERRIGGVGIHLVKTMMTRVSYERADEKNHLRIIKSLKE